MLLQSWWPLHDAAQWAPRLPAAAACSWACRCRPPCRLRARRWRCPSRCSRRSAAAAVAGGRGPRQWQPLTQLSSPLQVCGTCAAVWGHVEYRWMGSPDSLPPSLCCCCRWQAVGVGRRGGAVHPRQPPPGGQRPAHRPVQLLCGSARQDGVSAWRRQSPAMTRSLVWPDRRCLPFPLLTRTPTLEAVLAL